MATPIDVPSAIIMEQFGPEIKKSLEEAELPNNEKMVVEKIEWTKKGLRVWVNTK